jgi:hypothetical protein
MAWSPTPRWCQLDWSSLQELCMLCMVFAWPTRGPCVSPTIYAAARGYLFATLASARVTDIVSLVGCSLRYYLPELSGCSSLV